MQRTPRHRQMLLALAVLVCWALLQGGALFPHTGWQLSVEVAQVKVSFGTVVAPVRNRTSLFDFGQVAGMLGLAR